MRQILKNVREYLVSHEKQQPFPDKEPRLSSIRQKSYKRFAALVLILATLRPFPGWCPPKSQDDPEQPIGSQGLLIRLLADEDKTRQELEKRLQEEDVQMRKSARDQFDITRPTPRDIIIPPIATGYEEIYEKFLRGRLIYKPDPNSDSGRIEFPIRDLLHPLEGTFDLSSCGEETNNYVSISTGYRKGRKPENYYKLEIWIVPWFLINSNLTGNASHFQPIMDWNGTAAPVGLFWNLGIWDDLVWYDYLTINSLEQLSDNNLYEKHTNAAPCRAYPPDPTYHRPTRRAPPCRILPHGSWFPLSHYRVISCFQISFVN